MKDSILLLTPEERKDILGNLTDEQALAILYDWEFWARDSQLSPSVRWLIWLLQWGRGSGKTRTGSELVRSWADEGYSPIALVGQSKADCRDTMVELGESSILKISPPNFMPEYEPSKRRLVWPNGVVGIIYSGDEPDQLRGPQHSKAWVDELAKYRYPQQTWDNLMFGLRIGDNPQVIVTTTPRPIPIIKKLRANPKAVITHSHTLDNIDNLAPEFLEYVMDEYGGTRLGRQELAGELLDDNPDALWNREIIERNRCIKAPELVKVAVGVDPEASSKEGSSETGIVAAGRDRFGECYVLEDCSLRDKPAKWGRATVVCFHKTEANIVVGEGNNGGEMVEHVIRTVPGGPEVPFKLVHASRGKQTRAEPIASAYEANKIHHVGNFPELEDQMCEWVPGIGDSPDRVDALVWVLTELGIGKHTKLDKMHHGHMSGVRERYA